MDPLLDRAVRIATDHPSPALPVRELLRLVQGSGVAVTEGALDRALTGAGGRLRVVDPWLGPWATIRKPADRRGRLRIGPTGAAEEAVEDGPFVIAAPPRDGKGRSSPWAAGALDRLRATVVHLGWTVDRESVRDLSRWCALVREAERARRRWGSGGRGTDQPRARKSPDRHSPSASTATPRRASVAAAEAIDSHS